MADAVPVCDVLREAMEYLSKLGSNLRVRSESLKEKRLRKEKLKNVHAVQKAAGKVLLICELSKKSIENVEVGVKNILTQIDASQASVDCEGESIEKSDLSKSSVKYEYFQHGSRTLRIRDKVNIKHYTSVKVLAKPMSTLMQEQYPVYYNCRLYHARKTEQKDTHEPEPDDTSNVNSKYNRNVNENFNKDKRDDLSEDHSSSEDKKSDECDVNVAKKVKISNDKKDGTCKSSQTGSSRIKITDISNDKDNVNKKPVGEKRKKFKHIKVFNSSDSDTGTNENMAVSKEKVNSDCDISGSEKDGIAINKDEINKNEIDDRNLKKKDGQLSVTSEVNDQDHEVDISFDTQDIPRESDNVESVLLNEVQTDMPKDKVNDITSKTIESNDSVIVEDNVGDNNNSEDKNETTIKDDTIESEVKTNQKESSPKISMDKESARTVETNESTDNSTEKEDCLHKVGEDETDKTSSHVGKPHLENESSQNSTESRPLIKCVNINKLLREDKIPKTVSLIEIDDSDSDKDFKKSNHKENSKPNKCKTKLKKIKRISVCSDKDENKTDDEEYWKQKRKEVKLFKPKKFVVNVSLLPKFTTKYLHKNHLKRITQNGTVVCEVSMDKEKESQLEDDPKQLNISVEGENVKNALLYESDTDNDDRSKHALLDDSDSDNHAKDKQNGSHSIKNQENKSDSKKVRSRKNSSNKSKSRSNTPPSTNKLDDKNLDNNKIKSSLLNDSTDDSKTPKKKRKSLSDELSPPPSKRKHIMESMHAKKMLLTYSSSSDTEDEQLRNALKEIRHTLLKGNSSDDDNHENEKDSESSSKQCAVEPNGKDNENLATDNDTSAKDTNSLVDDNTEEKSNACSEKVRSY